MATFKSGAVSLFFAAATLSLLCLTAPARCDEVKIMPASQVRAGMRGYGLTTLDRGEVERFEVEVLGVVRGWYPKADVILIKMSGRLIDEAGVISGMSGSPIYIDDRLVGAVAYGWQFCQIPLAGVTPAEEMLRVEKLDREDKPSTDAKRKARLRNDFRQRAKELAQLLDRPEGDALSAEAVNRHVLRVAANLPWQRTGCRWETDEMQRDVRASISGILQSPLRPLPLPLSVTGLDGRSAEAVLPLLRQSGFFPVQASARARARGPEPPLAPGVPVGAVLIRGDMDISAMGTLTSVVGRRVVAFGHPMFGSGRIDLPLALGRVQAVVPSRMHSFRISSAGGIIGRITQDRQSAIVGRLGEVSGMFPCKVNVRGAVQESYDFSIASYWELCPLLTLMAISESVARTEGMGNPCTLTAESEIRIKGHRKPLVLRNVYVSFLPEMPALRLAAFPLEALMFNEFKEVEVQSITFNLDVREGFQAAKIESLTLSHRELEPGQTLTLSVGLREFQGAEVLKRIDLKIPEDAQPGTRAEILVCDATRSFGIRMGQDPGLFDPRDFDSLLESLSYVEQNTNLMVHASFLRRGLRYEGQAMPQLPPSALSMLQFSSEVGKVTPLVRDVRVAIQTPWVVQGAQRASIVIREPERGVNHAY